MPFPAKKHKGGKKTEPSKGLPAFLEKKLPAADETMPAKQGKGKPSFKKKGK